MPISNLFLSTERGNILGDVGTHDINQPRERDPVKKTVDASYGMATIQNPGVEGVPILLIFRLPEKSLANASVSEDSLTYQTSNAMLDAMAGQRSVSIPKAPRIGPISPS